MTGSATQGITTVLRPVSDRASGESRVHRAARRAAAAGQLLLRRLRGGGQQIGLVPGGGPQGMTSPVAYWQVADIEAKLAGVTQAGAIVSRAG